MHFRGFPTSHRISASETRYILRCASWILLTQKSERHQTSRMAVFENRSGKVNSSAIQNRDINTGSLQWCILDGIPQASLAGQIRCGRHPSNLECSRNKKQSKQNNSSKTKEHIPKEPCCNGNMMNCSLWTCRQSKDYARVKANVDRWNKTRLAKMT